MTQPSSGIMSRSHTPEWPIRQTRKGTTLSSLKAKDATPGSDRAAGDSYDWQDDSHKCWRLAIDMLHWRLRIVRALTAKASLLDNEEAA